MWTKVVLNSECPGLPWGRATLSLCFPAPLSQGQSHEVNSAFSRERLTLTHHGNTSENSASNSFQTGLVRDRASRGHLGFKCSRKAQNCKRRGGKEGPGQLPTGAGCEQVCNPGEDSKLPASGKKTVGLHTLEFGAYLEEHSAGQVWGCFIQNGESELSAFLPLAFFISTKVFFLSVRRREFHPDCTSPFSSSK